MKAIRVDGPFETREEAQAAASKLNRMVNWVDTYPFMANRHPGQGWSVYVRPVYAKANMVDVAAR